MWFFINKPMDYLQLKIFFFKDEVLCKCAGILGSLFNADENISYRFCAYTSFRFSAYTSLRFSAYTSLRFFENTNLKNTRDSGPQCNNINNNNDNNNNNKYKVIIDMKWFPGFPDWRFSKNRDNNLEMW